MADWLPETAVITGGASGIGLGLARDLAARGTRVMIADLAGEALDAAAAEIGALKQACDVSDLAEVQRLADSAFEALGHVDLLINNAGVNGVHGKAWRVDPKQARAHFDVNFWGVWNGVHAFGERIAKQGREAAIYNTGSENSFFCAVPQSAAYIAAKHAVLGLTESMREDFPSEVAVGLIVPGWVFTGLGDPAMMKHGMSLADYAAIIVPQVLARQRFVVSHGYNMVRIAERMDALEAAYKSYALPEAEDAKHDVRAMLAKLRG
jgi:NAD(P)-dependent dehydrogenase (short-subunit alcohol dehydrogenase family)